MFCLSWVTVVPVSYCLKIIIPKHFVKTRKKCIKGFLYMVLLIQSNVYIIILVKSINVSHGKIYYSTFEYLVDCVDKVKVPF